MAVLLNRPQPQMLCPNMKKLTVGQKLRHILRPVVNQPVYKHDPLLIHSLAEFNFRPPIILKFPGDRLVRTTSFSQ